MTLHWWAESRSYDLAFAHKTDHWPVTDAHKQSLSISPPVHSLANSDFQVQTFLLHFSLYIPIHNLGMAAWKLYIVRKKLKEIILHRCLLLTQYLKASISMTYCTLFRSRMWQSCQAFSNEYERTSWIAMFNQVWMTILNGIIYCGRVVLKIVLLNIDCGLNCDIKKNYIRVQMEQREQDCLRLSFNGEFGAHLSEWWHKWWWPFGIAGVLVRFG